MSLYGDEGESIVKSRGRASSGTWGDCEGGEAVDESRRSVGARDGCFGSGLYEGDPETLGEGAKGQGVNFTHSFISHLRTREMGIFFSKEVPRELKALARRVGATDDDIVWIKGNRWEVFFDLLLEDGGPIYANAIERVLPENTETCFIVTTGWTEGTARVLDSGETVQRVTLEVYAKDDF